MRSSLLAVLVGASVCPFVPAVLTSASGQTSLGEAIATVRERQAARRAASDAAGPKGKIFDALFTKHVSVDFDATPARDAIDYLRTALGVHLIARYSDDPVGHGIDPKTPITLEMTDASAVEVLDLVLEQCSLVEQCTWQVRKSFLEVGTRDRLSVPAAQEVRIYPIDELLYEAPDFTNAPPSGFGYGYPGWVSYNGGTPDPHMYLDSYSYRYYGGYLGAGVGYGYGYGGGGGYGGYSGAFGPGVSQGTVTTFGTDTNSSEEKSSRAEKIVDLITSLIEPEAWDRNGGAWATIRYHDGSLIVRAPDFIQRQLGGYPRLPKQDEGEAPAPGSGAGTGSGAPGAAAPAPGRGAAAAPRTAPGAQPATGSKPR